MDYEKKYKDTLERAKKLYEQGTITESLSYVFPELAESNDEKTRKRIIALVNAHGQGMYKGDMLAWLENIPYTIDREKREGFHLGYKAGLEKQGTPNQTSIWKHWKDGIAGNGEGKPIYLIKYGHTYSLSSCLCFECDYIELSELDKLMLEKQGETVWSEETDDDAWLNDIISKVESGCILNSSEIKWLKSIKDKINIHYWTEEEIEPIISDYLRGAEHYGGMIGRLRCLKPKPLEKQGTSYTKRDVDDAYLKGISDAKNELEKQGEQKSAWSEEDEEHYKACLQYFDEVNPDMVYYKDYQWLKSLKQRKGG